MTTPADDDELIRLRWALQALAQPAAVQVTLFPDFTCKADELALEYDEQARPILAGRCAGLTADQASALRVLDGYLDAVSGGGDNQANWLEEALHHSPVWIRIRLLAGDVLTAFGWDRTCPPRERGYLYCTGPDRDP